MFSEQFHGVPLRSLSNRQTLLWGTTKKFLQGPPGGEKKKRDALRIKSVNYGSDV